MNTWGNDQLKKLLEVNLQVTNRISCCDLFVLILWAGIDFLALVSARYNMSYLAKMLGGKKAKPKAKKKSKKKIQTTKIKKYQCMKVSRFAVGKIH